MVGHDAVAATGAEGDRAVRGRRLVAGLGAAAVLALATALLVALLGGTASAQTAPGPQPYGGALEQVDPANRVTSEEVLQVGMLALGTLNGLAFVVAMIASRLRGPSTAQTRRALITRTGAGTVSESRRERRERARHRPAAAPTPAPASAAAGGPNGRVPRTPPEGAVPAQSGPIPRETLVPAGVPSGPPARPSPSIPRAPGGQRQQYVPGPPGRPIPGPGPAPSPPAGVAAPLRPAIRR